MMLIKKSHSAVKEKCCHLTSSAKNFVYTQFYHNKCCNSFINCLSQAKQLSRMRVFLTNQSKPWWPRIVMGNLRAVSGPSMNSASPASPSSTLTTTARQPPVR